MAATLKVILLVSVYINMHLFASVSGRQKVTQVNKLPGQIPLLSSFSPPKKDDFYIMSSRGLAKPTSRAAPEIKLKTLGKKNTNSKTISATAYQNQMVSSQAKPEKPGSQDAPADATSGLLTMHPKGKPKKNIFCYYGSSANSRPEIGKFWPEHIDPFLCTHLIFAFVDITEDGTGIKPNNWNDMGSNGLYARTIRLKKKNPDLKILLAVGGWKIGSKPFIPIMKSEKTWRKWVSNVISYLRKFEFDGLDMDWEFPAWRGSAPEDRHKFTLLMKDLYEGFAAEAKSSDRDRLLLTLATASSAFYAEKSYEQSEIHKYIDFMFLMTYNYHGSGWEKQTGHHSPLLPHSLDTEGEQRELYALWSVKYWLNFGVPKEKIVLGLATYGLGWKLTDSSQTGIKAPADGGNTKGKYTEESGILAHYEICEKVINEGWKVKWIEEQKVPYAYGGGEWVGFDSPDSFYLKAATIVKENLAGAFVWSVEMDDFSGHCGGPKYPLLRTIYEAFTQPSKSSNVKSESSLKAAPAAGHLIIPSVQKHEQSSSAAAVTGPLVSNNYDQSSSAATVTGPLVSHNHDQSSSAAAVTGPLVSHNYDQSSSAAAVTGPLVSHNHDKSSSATAVTGPLVSHNHDQSSSAAAVTGPLVSHNHDNHDQEPASGGLDDHSGIPSDEHQNEADSETEAEHDIHDEDMESKAETDYPSYYSYDDSDDSFDEAVNCGSLGLGIHADPTSCDHFVLCMPASQHHLGSTRMLCPAGTLFDDKLKVCNHEHSVVCQH